MKGVLASTYKLQSSLSEHWSVHRASNVKSSMSSRIDSARLNSVSSSESGAFLRLAVLSVSRSLSDIQFTTACRSRLGMCLQVTSGLSQCDWNRHSIIDSTGTHLYTCPKGNQRQIFYNALNRVISELAHNAGIHNKSEPCGVFNNETDTRKRPDLILYAPKIKTIMHENGWLGDVVVDASLTYPLSNSALQLFNTAINRDDYLPAVEKREREKISKYSVVATSNNLAFVPAVADLFGSWSVHLSSLVRELVDKAAYRSTISKSILLEY